MFRSDLNCRLVQTLICTMLIGLTPGFAQQRSVNRVPELNLSSQQLNQLIVPSSTWNPYPDLLEPEKFNAVPANIRQAYIAEATKLLTEKWPPLPATLFLEYNRNGNRTHYEALSFERRRDLAMLVLAEVFERKGRFTDQIVNGIWAISEESFWGVPAHLNLQKAGFGLPDVNDPVVDLFAAETAAELAWVYYLLKPQLDKINPLISKRIDQEVNRRILIPYLKHTDWAYLGFQWRAHPDSLRRVNNWNPWINSNVLTAALILAKGGQRNLIIQKTLQSVQNFIDPFPADGGSDEGPQYWLHSAGALLDYLELLKNASNGKIDIFNNPIIKNMGSYIYKMYIKGSYFFNYADADAQINPDAGLLYRFGKQLKNDTLLHFAAYMANQSKYGHDTLQSEFGVLNRVLPGLHIINELIATKPGEPLLRDVWLPGVQIMVARDKAGSSAGLYLAVKGGNNGTSHNHNDIGNFIVYANGRPLLIDAGAQDYTAQTFSNKRYELWNNQSGYHNLSTINGVMQGSGSAFCAHDIVYKQNDKRAEISMSIAAAYPAGAKVISAVRKVGLYRCRYVKINETIKLSAYKQPLVENLMTPIKPDITSPGIVWLTDTLSGQKHGIYYDRQKFTVYADQVPVPDKMALNKGQKVKGRMEASWGDCLYRVRLVSKSQSLGYRYQIIIR